MPFMEYFCQVWADASNCYLDILNNQHKCICMTVVGPIFVASVEPMGYCQNIASLNLFIDIW